MEKPPAYKKFLILAVATLGGVGYVPLLQGTAASLAAAGVFLCFRHNTAYFIFVMVSLAAAFVFSGPAEKILGRKDARQIVIDDFAGMLLGLLFMPHTIVMAGLGFFLFRVFDSLKVYPAGYFESCPGSLGVAGDDVVAGLYTLLFLNLIIFVKHLL